MTHDPIRYWLQSEEKQNFGDYLSELFVDKVILAPKIRATAFHLIGSVISDPQVRRDLKALEQPDGLVAFWGCGLRNEIPLSDWTLQRARFFGVRGPLTRDVLGLPADTTLGDPGILVPLIHAPAKSQDPGGALCVVHALDPRDDGDILAQTGVDRVVRALIPATRDDLLAFIDQLAQAEFVLSGALHGAIVACAYGAPFAYYDSGYVDIPFKWRDFAASVGIPSLFAHTLEEGRTLWRDELQPSLQRLPLTPLLAACPFVVKPDLMLRAMVADGLLEAAQAAPCIAALTDDGLSGAVWREEAQDHNAALMAVREAPPPVALPVASGPEAAPSPSIPKSEEQADAVDCPNR